MFYVRYMYNPQLIVLKPFWLEARQTLWKHNMSTMETSKLRITQKAKRKEKKAVIHHKYGTTVLKIESLFGLFSLLSHTLRCIFTNIQNCPPRNNFLTPFSRNTLSNPFQVLWTLSSDIWIRPRHLFKHEKCWPRKTNQKFIEKHFAFAPLDFLCILEHMTGK